MICMISIAVVCACCGTDVLYIMSLPARLLSMCALKKCQQIQAMRMHIQGPNIVLTSQMAEHRIKHRTE